MWSSLSKEFWFRLSITRQSSATNVRWKSHWCAQDVHIVQWMPCVHYGSGFLTYRHTRRCFLTLCMGIWNVLLTRTLWRKYDPWYFGVGWNLTTIRGIRLECTWAWKNNLPTEYIMLQGDWRSTSWLSFLEIPLVTRWKMAKLLTESGHLWMCPGDYSAMTCTIRFPDLAAYKPIYSYV